MGNILKNGIRQEDDTQSIDRDLVDVHTRYDQKDVQDQEDGQCMVETVPL